MKIHRTAFQFANVFQLKLLQYIKAAYILQTSMYKNNLILRAVYKLYRANYLLEIVAVIPKFSNSLQCERINCWPEFRNYLFNVVNPRK